MSENFKIFQLLKNVGELDVTSDVSGDQMSTERVDGAERCEGSCVREGGGPGHVFSRDQLHVCTVSHVLCTAILQSKMEEMGHPSKFTMSCFYWPVLYYCWKLERDC